MNKTEIGKALAVAGSIAAGRGQGISQGILGSAVAESQVCLQAIRLIKTMDIVAEAVESDPSLLGRDVKAAHKRLIEIIESRDECCEMGEQVSSETPDDPDNTEE